MEGIDFDFSTTVAVKIWGVKWFTPPLAVWDTSRKLFKHQGAG